MSQTPGIPWSLPNAGFSIQPVNGEFAAWSQGSSVPPDGWSMDAGAWGSAASRCQGGTGPWAVDFGTAAKQGRIVTDLIVVLPNTKYLLSALYRIVTGTGQSLSQGVRIDFYNDSRALISSTNLDLIANTSGAWTYLGMDVVTPTSAVYAKVLAGRFNENGSTTLQIDAVKFDRSVYIPSGVISLDDVTDGAVYGRTRLDALNAGYPFKVWRDGAALDVLNLFKRGVNTLDDVVDSATYGKVNLSALSAGNPKTDALVDGTYAKVLADHLTSGAITSITRAGVKYASSTFFNTGLDTLDNVANGTTYARVNATALSTGNPKMDSVVDGTYAKVLATHLTSGAITSLTRGGTLYGTSTFFQKALDTLDNVTDGASYGKVNLGSLSAGNFKTDNLVDGTYSKVAATMVDASKRITSVYRGAATESVDNLFKINSNTLDQVAEGTTYKRVAAAYVDASNRITSVYRGAAVESVDNLFKINSNTLDQIAEGTTYKRVAAAYIDASNRITSVYRGTTVEPVSNLFKVNSNTLDDVAEGTTYKRVAAAYIDASNRITSVYRGTTVEPVSNLFKINSNTLDDMAEGTTYKRLVAASVTSGYPSSVWRDGAALATSSLFKVGVNTLDDMAEGTTYKRIGGTYVTSTAPNSVYHSGSAAVVSAGTLFRKSTDTFASVAGTLADGQLGSNVVNTANIKDGNITGAKVADYTLTGTEFADGPPLRAYDEGDGTTLRGRANTFTNIDTVDASSNLFASNFSITASAPASYLTGFYYYNNTTTGPYTPHIVFRYKTKSGTWPATSTGRVSTVINGVTYSSTFTIYGDNAWHTVFIDASAWGSTISFPSSQIKMEFPYSGTNPSAGSIFQMGYFAVGMANGGSASGIFSLAGTSSVIGPHYIIPKTGQSLYVGYDGNGLETGSTAFVSTNASGTYINHVSAAAAFSWWRAGAIRAMTLDSNGELGIGTSTPAAALHVVSRATASTGLAIAEFRNPSDAQRITVVDETTTGSKPPGIKSPVAAFGLGLYAVNGPMILHVGGTDQERLRLDSAGAVYTPNGGSLGVGSGRWTSNGNDILLNTNGSSTVYIRPGGSGSTNWQYEASGASSYHRWLGASGAELARLNGTGLSIGTGGAAGWKLDLGHGALGTTLGATIYAISNYATTSNADYLRTFLYRNTGGGTSWTSADWYMERAVDTTTMGSVKYGGDGSISLAYNRVAKVRLFNDGWVYFDGFSGGGTTTASLDNAGKLIRTASDGSLKEDLQPLESALENVCLMNPVSFMWKNRKSFGARRDIGLVAQDVRMLVPEAVTSNPDGTLALDYVKLIPVLVGAIKDLKSRLDMLEAAKV